MYKLDKIKIIIGVENFYNSKILINTDAKLANEVNLKNAVMLICCVIKEGDRFYLQLFLEALVALKFVGVGSGKIGRMW